MKPLKKIEQTRAAREALLAERDGLVRQHRSHEEVRATVHEHVTRWCEEGRVRLRHSLVNLAHHPQGRAVPMLNARSGLATVDLGPVLAAVLGPEAIADILLRDLDTIPAGMDASTKAQRVAEITRELHDLEIAEEEAVCAAEADGEFVMRRPDVDLGVVLGEHPAPDPAKRNFYREQHEAINAVSTRDAGQQRIVPSPYVGTSR